MKIMKPLLFVLIIIPFIVRGQISENFNDGNYTQNPTWSGLTDKFIVNDDLQLQLNDSVENKAYLVTANRISGANEWRIWVKTRFSPSSNNFIRIYLLSDQNDLEAPLQGYFLQLGERGSDDALELFRQDGDHKVSVCRGSDGLLSSAFSVGIKVVRDDAGHWQLFTDPGGGVYYRKEATGYDATYAEGNYFGIYCSYTKSYSKKFYFDDVYSGAVIIDTEAPEVSTSALDSEHGLKVVFSETLDKPSAEKINHYRLLPGDYNPEKATLMEDGRTVLLHFANAFQNKSHYQLMLNSISDIYNNVMNQDTVLFDYYLPVAHDVVINEIMADPKPVVGLPDAEYLELYNTTDFHIDLSGWKMMIGSRERVIENAAMEPGDYLILCRETNASLFSDFGNVYGFSSFSLLNGGQQLVLSDTSRNIISEITYKDNWYGDSEKEDGGWSLEQINPKNSCSGKENWRASDHDSGGTPGSKNAVFDTVVLHPKLDFVEVNNEKHLNVFFNQKMDKEALMNSSFWSAGSSALDSVCVSDDSLQKAALYFSNPFEKGVRYQLHVSGNMSNCLGIQMERDTSVIFGVPESAGNKEVLFNEVLFRPRSGGAEYVEVANHSAKAIDLNTLLLGVLKQHSNGTTDTAYYPIADRQVLIFPDEYFVFSKDPGKVKQQYVSGHPENFIEMSSFPVLKNESGTLFLKAKNDEQVDAFSYSDDLHYPLLKRNDGVALERSDLNRETNDPENWHSASEDYGFGTPADENSQIVTDENQKNKFWTVPEIFSPNRDGKDDVLNIHYQLDKTGYSVQLKIFNASGALVRQLGNQYLGTSGSLTWDGLTDHHATALPGMYILFIQLYNNDGSLQTIKKTVVVAPKNTR